MRFERICVRTLPDGTASKVFPFHISTLGKESSVIFRDDEDHLALCNYIPLCARECNVIVVTFCVPDNHFHIFILAADYLSANRFADRLKGRYSRYHAVKYNERNIFLNVESKPILIEDDRHLRNAVCYILKNAKDAGGRVETYRFCSYSAYFAEGRCKAGCTPVKSMTTREARNILHTTVPLSDVKWVLDSRGMIDPVSYCDYRYVEEAFLNDLSFFMKVLGTVDTEAMEFEYVKNPRTMYPDREFRKIVESKCLEFHSRPMEELTLSEKVRMVKLLFRTHHTTPAQLARCLELPRETIEGIIK